MKYTDDNTREATTPADPIATIGDMIRDAERHADDLSADRIRAIEYNDGTMRDTPSDEGRSAMVSRDLRANIKKVLPSIMRTVFGAQSVVEYQPVGPGDEAGAEQATDYVNKVIVPEADVRRHIENAIHDALLLRNGILKWWWDERKCVKISEHSGLSEMAFAELASDDSVEVLEYDEDVEMVEMQGFDEMGQPLPAQQITVIRCKIRRMETRAQIRVSCVPRERFLIHPDAIDIQDSILTGEKVRVTRSDLISMGYDYETVMGLQQASDDDWEDDVRRDAILDGDESHRPNEVIDYYDVYVRYDMDEDGIAELRHMCFAGGLHERNLLMDEEADEVQFCDIKVMTRPHQWEGISLADDLMDIQRSKTVLMRQTLDNIYWQNNPQPIMQDGAVLNPDAVFSPDFGKPIRIRQGVPQNEAYGFVQVPFVAQQTFGMLEYLDNEAQDRTGVSDASAGLAPDALQNMTATASEMINQAGIGQTEMMVRTVAEGLRCFFRGLLKLTIRHQDIPRTVRLKGEWHEFDPRHWNADMDCTVNVGLGAGTRERDMQVMQFVMGLQEKLLAAFGPQNPFVKPNNVWEALSRSIEAAGLKTPEMYFTEPDPEEVQRLLEAQANGGQAQAQAEMQMEAQKAQMDAQIQQQKAQADTQISQQKMQAEIENRRMQMEAEMQLSREQMMAEMQLKREQMQAEAQLKREQMRMQATMPMTQSGGISQVRMGGEVG